MSTAPAAKRPRKRTIVRTVEMSRLDMLISGELKVEDLTDDEIRRQQLMNSQGDFRGRPPMWVPREFALAMQAEHFRRFKREMSEMVPDALKAVKEMLASRHLQPGDAARLRAAELVIERNFGKVTQNVDSHVVLDRGKSFEDYSEEILVDVDAIDADVVDELDAIEE